MIEGNGDPTSYAVIGDSTLANPSGFSLTGQVNQWLLLGPFIQDSFFNTANPGEDTMRLDWLADVDGNITEDSVMPVAGDTVNTDFDAGPASAVDEGGAGCTINPEGVPNLERVDRRQQPDCLRELLLPVISTI